MKQLILFILCGGLVFGQYVQVGPSDYVNVNRDINSKVASRAGSVPPSGNCTVAKDLYVDITSGKTYYCIGTNTWKEFPTIDFTGTLNINITGYAGSILNKVFLGNSNQIPQFAGGWISGRCVTIDSDGNLAAFSDGCGGTTPPVTSVFNRIGAVVAQSGDYTASQVTSAVINAGLNTINRIPKVSSSSAIIESTCSIDGSGNLIDCPHTHSANDIISDIFNPARLGSGTATANEILHGDSIWRAAKTIAPTTGALKGDGTGNAVAVTGTSTDCVLVDGSSGPCGSGGGNSVTVYPIRTSGSVLTLGNSTVDLPYTFGCGTQVYSFTEPPTVTYTSGLGTLRGWLDCASGSYIVATEGTLDITCSGCTEITASDFPHENEISVFQWDHNGSNFATDGVYLLRAAGREYFISGENVNFVRDPLSGSTTVSATGGGTINPFTKIYVIEDFITGGTDAGNVPIGSGWYSTGQVLTYSGEPNHPGIFTYQTTTTINDTRFMVYGAGNTSARIAGLASANWEATFLVRADQVTQSKYWVGLSNNATVGPAAPRAFGFTCTNTSSASTWFVVTRDSSTGTPVDTGVTVTTNWVKLKIVGSTTDVKFYIDGVLTNTLTTNRTDGGVTLSTHVITTEADIVKSISHDLVVFDMELTR